MNVTHKPTTPLFFLLFITVVMIIFYFIYDLAFTKPSKQSLATPSIKTDTQLLVNKQQFVEKQLIVDVKAEIISLKTEIKRINNKLSQLSSYAGQHYIEPNQEAVFTTEEIQAMESTRDDYEITNEMNRVNTANVTVQTPTHSIIFD